MRVSLVLRSTVAWRGGALDNVNSLGTGGWFPAGGLLARSDEGGQPAGFRTLSASGATGWVIRSEPPRPKDRIDGRDANPFRERCRLRADDGRLEPARRRYLRRLGRAEGGPQMDRRRMRERRLHRAPRRALRARRGPGHRSLGS